MTLQQYLNKRNFKVTPEPKGKVLSKKGSSLLYVVQKHRASHLHYDFRLEEHGVLLSWAIPKGPSLDPAVKRLAMRVEDHPLEYGRFEGVIPEGEYGAGTVMLWDTGTWSPEEDIPAEEALRRGSLKFQLHGKKLHGSWALVRTRNYRGSQKEAWLLIKHRDAYASKRDITLEKPRSVATGRLLAQIARDEGGDVEKAATGDPRTAVRASKTSA